MLVKGATGKHYYDVIMSTMASQITSLTVVYSIIYTGADQRKNQSSTSLAFVGGIHQWLVNSPHKRPVMQTMFPFDIIMGKDIFAFSIILFTDITHVAETLHHGRQVHINLYIINSWWPGNTRSQDISSHAIDSLAPRKFEWNFRYVI